MKAMWSGSISFGLINIPVKLYSAREQNRIDLDMLDSDDYSRIRYKRVNENTGEEVDWDDIVKGYKTNGSYVVLDDEDFERAKAGRSNNIKIDEFVDEEEIPDIYFSKPYYLEPDQGSERSYVLLLRAMKESGKAGVFTFVLRKRDHLAIIKPQDDVIVLDQLRFEEDIRNPEELDVSVEEDDIDEEEIDIAVDLIDKYEKEFDISDYHDTYTNELLEIIEAKKEGKELKEPAEAEQQEATESKELMSKLKESLKEAS